MYKTRYNEDFRWITENYEGIKKWHRNEELKSADIEQAVLTCRNNETLEQTIEECSTPFNYYLKPKPITQTNPLLPFFTPELPKDDSNAHLTRPRVYKIPQISLDDIEDQDIRKQIIDFTYSTTSGVASREAAAGETKRQVSNITWEVPHHVLFSKKEDLEGSTCEEGVMDSKLNEWDRLQSRAVGDSTKAFWQHYSTNQLGPAVKPGLTDKIINLAKENRLRLPYMLRPINYKGFMPECPIGMEPEKLEMELSDPMLTSYQLSNRWWQQ